MRKSLKLSNKIHVTSICHVGYNISLDYFVIIMSTTVFGRIDVSIVSSMSPSSNNAGTAEELLFISTARLYLFIVLLIS